MSEFQHPFATPEIVFVTDPQLRWRHAALRALEPAARIIELFKTWAGEQSVSREITALGHAQRFYRERAIALGEELRDSN